MLFWFFPSLDEQIIDVQEFCAVDDNKLKSCNFFIRFALYNQREKIQSIL